MDRRTQPIEQGGISRRLDLHHVVAGVTMRLLKEDEQSRGPPKEGALATDEHGWTRMEGQ